MSNLGRLDVFLYSFKCKIKLTGVLSILSVPCKSWSMMNSLSYTWFKWITIWKSSLMKNEMLMTNPKGTTILGIRVFKIMTLGISEYKCSKNYSSYLILDLDNSETYVLEIQLQFFSLFYLDFCTPVADKRFFLISLYRPGVIHFASVVNGRKF